MTDLPPDAGIDAMILDRMTGTLCVLQAKEASSERADLIAAMRGLRETYEKLAIKPDTLAIMVEGESEAAVVREYLAGLERTSLGASQVRVVRANASPSRVADILVRSGRVDRAIVVEDTEVRQETSQPRDRRMSSTPMKPDGRMRGTLRGLKVPDTPAEFVDALRQFRIWAGKPSFRQMQRRCGGKLAASTICTVLGGDTLPASLETVDGILLGCGADEEDRRWFLAAWRHVAASCDSGIRVPRRHTRERA